MEQDQHEGKVLLRTRRGGRWELRESEDGRRMVVYVTSKGSVGVVMMLPDRAPAIGIA